MTEEKSSQYIQQERRDYALYVLQSRAIPHIADGLKPAARRVLWIAKNGHKYKSTTLAGATMPIHPHGAPESTINTLAAPYGNNITLLKGYGAFGTLLNPTAYGASRYTSVCTSQFTKDVVFRDIELVPLVENYDGTLPEPKHFLPLVPIVLLNPQEGIAVGFSCNILPRSLDSIIKSQLQYLQNKKITPVLPNFNATQNQCSSYDKQNNKWNFVGSYEKLNATTIKITNLPYGITHKKFINKLNKLEEEGTIQEVTDNSKKHYDINVRFKKGMLTNKNNEQIIKLLHLTTNISENLNVIDFDGKKVLSTSYEEIIQQFCEWRLEWYYARYKRLADLLEIDIQKYKDILQAIRKNVGGIAKKIKSRAELKTFLEEIKIVHIDYIADLPVYRFTQDEKTKIEQKLKDANLLMKTYQQMLKSKEKRKEVFIDEIKEINTNYKKGTYNE